MKHQRISDLFGYCGKPSRASFCGLESGEGLLCRIAFIFQSRKLEPQCNVHYHFGHLHYSRVNSTTPSLGALGSCAGCAPGFRWLHPYNGVLWLWGICRFSVTCSGCCLQERAKFTVLLPVPSRHFSPSNHQFSPRFYFCFTTI